MLPAVWYVLRSVILGQYDGFLVVLQMCHKLRKLVDHGGSEADDDVNKVKLGIVRCAFTVSRSEFLAGEKLRDGGPHLYMRVYL